MAARGEVLVALLNDLRDFELARDEHWYRIPVGSMDKWLKGCWPPKWLAFYQTVVFGGEGRAVNYYSRVAAVRKATRRQLFPDEPPGKKTDRLYYQLMLEPLIRLPRPILSRRPRWIIFIPTTWEKFQNAAEINDLYDDSPLEDRLWAELRRRQIWAERQEFVRIGENDYALDFAVYCAKGNLDIETDGDAWHANPERSRQDNSRNNDLEAAGWNVLRFTTHQIREEAASYCVPIIAEAINKMGGLAERGEISRRVASDLDAPMQMGFDGELHAPKRLKLRRK